MIDPVTRRRDRDRDRKRLERERKRLARVHGSFSAWFRARVDELPPDGGAWSNRLALEMEELGYISNANEYDRSLRKIYDGDTQRPRERTAFAAGEALRAQGVPWASGAAALHAAGYLPQFYAVLCALAAGERVDGITTALRFVYATARANVDPADMTDAPFADVDGKLLAPTYKREDLEARLRDFHAAESERARQTLAHSEVGDVTAMRKYWLQLQTKNGRIDIAARSAVTRAAPEPFQLALLIATSESIPLDARERAATVLVDAWATIQFPGTRLGFVPDFVADLRPLSLALRERQYVDALAARREHSRKDTSK